MNKQSKKLVQPDWLDYWFKPQIERLFLRYGDALPKLKQLESDETAEVLSMEVKRDGYELTIKRKRAKHDDKSIDSSG